ncbi:magnesium transporter [Paenalcaligenes niemegkensis]|uniref:magnesium transporter n=1 Tax=Paenalcaligenes niemegkensis TaxID=2895469 RepID=UPI001EE88EB9|nr:magnesium transporter [Paenalcaligenes niemegkensis]MCQ9616357.1 magnesium transporter [Paenalcaligenes niemegkensis]
MNLDENLVLLRQLVADRSWSKASALLETLPSQDIAALLNQFDADMSLGLFRLCPIARLPHIFAYLKVPLQVMMSQRMSREEISLLLTHMDHDRRADLYNRLPEDARALILPGIAHAEREDIRKLASFPEGSVGAVMTSAYVTLNANMMAAEALEHVRLVAPDAETIYQCYVLDDNRHLIGTISLRQLLVALPNALIADLMVTEVIHAQASAPQIEAATRISHYDLLALPIIDSNGEMVGIVTHDDARDVDDAESADDQRRFGAVGNLAESLKDASISLLYRSRVGWLVVLVFGNLFSGAGIAHFEELIQGAVALVFFLPLLIDSGGNAGSQSSTLMVRALATGEVKLKDWFQLILKESSVALLLGLTMAAAVSMIGLWRGGPEIALILALTMVLIVMVGSLIGMSLPFVFTRLKLDPASASAPLITSICDASGVIIYFSIANAILGLN